MNKSIVPIVEGHGEVDAVGGLLRRILHGKKIFHIDIARPFRVKRNRVVRRGELERAVEMASNARENVAGLIIILDADDDCPAELGTDLAKRAAGATSLPVLVVIANREFESWFLGAKESLRGIRGIRLDAASPPEPENIRGAKERLSRNMENNRRYLEVDDQPAFADRMDLESAAEKCPSFNRFLRKLEILISDIIQTGT